MMRKRTSTYNLADVAVATRRVNYSFFKTIDKNVDWKEIETIIDNNYSKGTRIDGRPAYPGLLLFKICCIEKWFGFHHKQTEYRINDSITFTRFIGLSLNEEVPSTTTVSRFKKEMTEKNIYNKLSLLLEKQLEAANLKIFPGQSKRPRILKKN